MAYYSYCLRLLTKIENQQLVNNYKVKYLSNHSECFLQLQKFPEAKLDIDAALIFDPKHEKTLKKKS